MRALLGRWGKRLDSGRALNGVGIAAAVLLFSSVNVLGSRFFSRWDTTSEQLYSLSPVTLETLSALSEPLEVVVFMSRVDPLTSSVRYMLDAYRARSGQLSVRYADPDRDPVQFIALQRQYGIFEGKTENGRLATEASIVVARGEKRWFITTDDLVAFDDEGEQAKPKLEQALTEGIVNVQGQTKTRLCFTLGHGELAVTSGGPQGLSEFRGQLERNNYEVRTVDLAVGDPARVLQGCEVVFVVGPLAPFAGQEVTAIGDHVQQGASLLLALGPIVDESGNILASGFEGMTAPWGVHPERALVFERDDSLSLPVGFGGEVFLGTPEAHPTTKSLLVGDDVRLRVVFQLAQEIVLDDTTSATALFRTSDRAVALGSFKALSGGEFVDAPKQTERRRVVAAALELHATAGNAHGPRVVLLGSASPLWSSTWVEPSLIGTRRFVEGATSWLASQPSLVSVPEKASHPAGLFLTEDALGEIQRYVLLYVPLTVLALAGLVLFRRRADEPHADERDTEREDGT
jgi:ABC-type uncharacterized transport system